MNKLKYWSQLSEIQKIRISENYYSYDAKTRSEIRKHKPNCPCDLKTLGYTTACYPSFFASILKKFNTDIDFENFDEAIDAAKYLPVFTFNLLPLCTDLNRAKKLMKISKKVYKHLPNEFKNDKEIANLAMYSFRGSMIRHVPNHIKNNPRYAAKAIKHSIDALRFFNKETRESSAVKKLLTYKKTKTLLCQQTMYFLPQKLQKLLALNNRIDFFGLMTKSKINCRRVALYNLMNDFRFHQCTYNEHDEITKWASIHEADKIITKKNFDRFGDKVLTVYFLKFLETFSGSTRPNNISLNIVLAIIDVLLETVENKTLKRKLKAHKQLLSHPNPFLRVSEIQMIKKIQSGDLGQIINKLARKAKGYIEVAHNSKAKSVRIAYEGIFDEEHCFIHPLHKRHKSHHDDVIPF